MKIPRIMITAMRSGAGKTMITCGILKAWKMQGKKIASFKCGPDYIDPMFHKTVIGVSSYNLDSYMCGKDGVRKLLMKNGKNSEIAVMEGVMGYYDGIAGISTDASAYDIADITDTPAILVLDCKGLSVSAVPCVEGFLHYRENSHIQGVILNRLSPMMYGRVKQMIEEQTGVKVYGYVPVMPECALESRYLGLKLPKERSDIEERLTILGEKLQETLDLEGLLELAGQAPELAGQEETAGNKENLQVPETIRIGIAKDEAFCFIYEDNLDLLRKLGAELVPFSPVHDKKLPDNLAGLIFYGGYPELYGKELSENRKMRDEVRQAVSSGMPCIAECGGFMYLQENIVDADAHNFPMTGVLKGKSYNTGSLRRFGYIMLEGGTVFGKDVGNIPAHEFHYYDSQECGDAFLAKKPMSTRSWKCMISTDTLLAGYPHIHYYGNEQVPETFLEKCRSYRKNKQDDELQQMIKSIRPADVQVKKLAQKKWNSIAKPLHSLGKLEEHVMRIAALTGDTDVGIEKKALIVMCADNGVVEEGVTQTGQEVTAIVAENFLSCNTSAAIMCKKAGVDLFPVDIGMVTDTKVPDYKVAYGTANMAKGPAMTRKQAVKAILTGIHQVKEKKEAGYRILATGEMGIGNTTTSSAVASVLLKEDPEVMTGRGAGLTGAGLKRKIEVIKTAIRVNQPDPDDPVDVLAKIGGFDLAGMTGIFLGGAIYRIPVVVDGFISAVAALAAVKMCEEAKDALIVSHVSKEPGMHKVLDCLQMEAPLCADMCLGEGTGAVAYLPVLDLAVEVYQKMSTFSDNDIKDYEELGGK